MTFLISLRASLTKKMFLFYMLIILIILFRRKLLWQHSKMVWVHLWSNREEMPLPDWFSTRRRRTRLPRCSSLLVENEFLSKICLYLAWNNTTFVNFRCKWMRFTTPEVFTRMLQHQRFIPMWLSTWIQIEWR